ncbi:LpqN/LpqT family lipoprotein [Mycolicibacterium lacusdiani]|uniref:LpqN/LpqT family lipoprotein n=1 Tax=Mycolicibacterium lacusdiani TaxID=2895283 RepID=UPI001F1FFE06|nr:LpqN/LpqT family lipoprotein [Mycolicibacterium lacusdiani]
MFATARRWGFVAGGVAVGVAGVVGFAGTTASAEPSLPLPPVPAPATVTQTVVVQAGTPGLAGQPAIAPAGAPGPAATPVAALASPALPPAPAPPTIPPATSGTIADFLRSKNVAMEPQVANGFTALNIVLPMPAGWSHVPDPNVPDAFAVIADRLGGDGLYTSNAALNVYKLLGDFDPKEAISHGFIESQQLPAWRSTDGSMADFGGMPSSIIEGTYRQNNMTLNTSRRHVIAQSGPDRYLVTLSVTTSAQVSVAAGDATDAIVNGFRVGSAVPPPAAPPAPAPGIPGLPPLPPLPGIPS